MAVFNLPKTAPTPNEDEINYVAAHNYSHYFIGSFAATGASLHYNPHAIDVSYGSESRENYPSGDLPLAHPLLRSLESMLGVIARLHTPIEGISV